MPNVTSVSPAPNATGVVLGQPISVVFDSLIDHTTLTSATVSVSYPSAAEVLTPDAYIAKSPKTMTGIAYVDGTITATDSSTATTLVFQPLTPLKPNTQYTVFLLGGDAQFSSASIKDTQGNPLAVSYQWTFTTGSVNLPAPPVSSPLPPVRGAVVIPLDPGTALRRKAKELTRGRRFAFRYAIRIAPGRSAYSMPDYSTTGWVIRDRVVRKIIFNFLPVPS